MLKTFCLLFSLYCGTTPALVAEPMTPEQHIIYLAKQEQVDPNLLIKIARCESGLRQFNDDGSVIFGVVNPLDTGLFQLNQKYHLEESKRLGYDIFTEEGNIGYAVYLFKTEGSTPWRYSSFCWSSGLDGVGTSSIIK